MNMKMKVLFISIAGLWAVAAWASYEPHVLLMNVASVLGLQLGIIYLVLERRHTRRVTK